MAAERARRVASNGARRLPVLPILSIRRPKAGLMRRIAILGCTAIAAFAWASLAVAGEPDGTRGPPEPRENAPARAFEATLGTGYTQGFGQLTRGGANDVNDVVNGGGAIELGLGARLSPRLSLGVEGQYQDFGTGMTLDSGASARGAAFDVDVQYHFAPYRRLDPWLKLATGYRMLWQSPVHAANTMWHGLDLLKVQAGLDFRSGPGVAIGPMIGADLNVFLWTRRDGGANSALADPRLSTFVYAGIQGRFDAGGIEVRDPTIEPATAF